MNQKLVKALESLSVIVAIVISVLAAMNLPLETVFKGSQDPVTLAMTGNGLPEDFIGKPAGDDIPRIEDAGEWDDVFRTFRTSYVTIEPLGIISAGVGVRHPWVDAYAYGRRGSARYTYRRADVRSTAFDVFDEYGEYYILELPDHSYILAQMSKDDARKIKAGMEITLPIGIKKSADSRVLSRISALCAEYDVITDGVFYCIDDQWNERHDVLMTFVRIGVMGFMTIVLGAVLINIADRFLKKKEKIN